MTEGPSGFYAGLFKDYAYFVTLNVRINDRVTKQKCECFLLAFGSKFSNGTQNFGLLGIS